jgi:nitroreductase
MSAANLTGWDITPSAFPTTASRAEQARFAVAYAILAPSSHNTQPWRFLVSDSEVLVCADRSRSLPVIDPYDRELVISCGAALFNLRVALARFGLATEIHLLPQANDPDILARVTFAPGAAIPPGLGEFIDAITRRRTNRLAFADEPPPLTLEEKLRAAAAREGVNAAILRAAPDRARVAELIAQADRQQFADPHFRRELASWIHPSRRDDGMPAFSQGMAPLVDAATPIAAMVIRTFDVGHGVAAAHGELARGSPMLAVLATRTDNQEAWLATGQALERLLLAATEAGYSASYLNQPIEVPQLRARLAEELVDELDAARYPQLILRIGRGGDIPPSPRRPLADVCA